MKRTVLLLALLTFAFFPGLQRTLATPATSQVSGLEITGMQMLYAVNDDQFDFNDAYLIDNSGSIPIGSFPRVAYYLELVSGTTTNWVWVSLDTFNADPTRVGVPKAGSNIVENGTRVSNLNVESNHPNVTPGRGLEGIIEFWASNYSGNGGGAFGSNDEQFDWKDSGGTTGGGHGSFQIFAFTNPGLTAAQTLFGVSANGGSGIGDQPGNPPGNAPDWTFGPNSSTYTIRNLEIWVGDNRNAAPVLNDLDGDTLVYTPGVDGEIEMDQTPTAGAADPAPLGPNGWSNGTLRVSITAGGGPADDQFSILDEGSNTSQIGFDGSLLSYEGTLIGNVVGGTSGVDLLITFNPSASTAAISNLLNNLTFNNANPNTSPLSRQISITLTDGDGAASLPAIVQINMNVGGVANTFVWEGDVSSDFHTPGNWDGNAVPDANDTAIFRDAGAGTVALGGGATVGEIRFDSTGSFSLSGGTLIVATIDQQASASGSNTIAAQIDAVGLAGNIAAGTLALNNLANTFSGTIRVSGGTLQAEVLGSQSGLGAATVELDGGDLDLRGVPEQVNGLHHYGYQPIPFPNNNDLDLDNNGGLMGGVALPGGNPELGRGFTSRTLLTDGPAGRGLDFNGDADFINTGVISQADQYANLFIATLTVAPADAGDWTFRRLQDDDAMGIWVDLNQNGIFESSTPGLQSDRGEQLQWDNDNVAKTVGLAAGDYLVAFTHREGVSGSQIEVALSTPNLAEEIIKPTDPDQLGFFRVIQNSVGTLPNTVRGLTSGSRIITDALMTLDHLDITTALLLQIDGEGAAFAETTLDGDLSIITTNGAPLSLSAVTGAGGLIQNGNGTLNLPTPNSYTGLTTIHAGIIRTDASSALGTIAQGTIVNTNGSLQVFGGNHSEPLELHGVGNATSDGALNKAAGLNVFWTGLITVPIDARIYSEGNELLLDGGIDLTGTNLTIDAQNRVSVRFNGISGDANTTLRFEGNDRTDLEVASPNFLGDIELFNDGFIDVYVSGAMGDGAGVTRLLADNTTLLLRNICTHIEDLEIEGDGRGNIGAIRMENGSTILDGSITLTGDATIVTRNNSLSTLTVLGPVLGGFNLTQRENATLVLTQDSDINHFGIDLGGTIRIGTAGGLGTTERLVLDTGEALEFNASMSFDGSTLGSISLNGGSVNSVSGETTLDIPVSVSATSALNFGGDGDLNILQPIGNGDVPVAVPGALSIFGFDIDNNNLALNLDQNGGMVNGVPPDPAAATNLNFLAEALLTDGPGGRGLDFDSDEDFQNAGVIPTNQFDRYSTLFIGYLNVHAAQAGDWQFQRLADDDQIGIWLDVNTNGIFESTPVGFGSNRDEQLQWDGDGGIKTRTLAEGRYLFAATHHEGTGGSQAHVVFKSPLMGSLANIKPGDANQAGMWEPLGAAAPGIQAANALNKSGAGVLRLFADNPFNQEVNITGGMIVAAHDQSLGTDTAIFASNGSLAFTNNVTIAGKTLNARGALEPVNLINLGDDNAFLGDILVSDFPSLGFSTTSPAGRLTVGTPGNHVLTLGPSKLTLDGPGEIVVNSDVSNTTGITGVNALRHYGYHFRNDGIALDLDQNGGMMGGGDPTTFQNFFGQAFLTTGPGGRGLDYDNDQDFQNEGVIATTQNDNYSDLVLGYLVVSPAEAGDWEFRRNVDDDNMGIWLDLNQNAIFESTTAGLDSDRGEQLQYDNDGETKIVTLAAGAYLFAVTHAEEGGGSQVHVQFKAPSMPAQLTVNPGDPVQDGIWQLYFDSSDEVEKQGSGTATLTGNNTYVGPTTLLDGVLIAGSPAALGDTTDGTVANGGTLAIPSGATYSTAETLILNGTGAADMPGALVSLGGLTTINPPTVIVAHSNAMIAGIGSLADTFTVNPDIDLGYAALSASGEGDIILNGEVHGLGLGASQPPYPLEVLGDAPLLYYQLNETSGSNVVNSGTAGSTFDGMVFDGAHTDLNVPSLDTTLGTAAAFDDNIASGITTPFSMNVLSNQFTIEAWVMSPSPQNNRSGVAGQNDAYEFGMASGTEIELWSPAAAAFRTPYPSGEWFHLVATGDGSNRTIYVNGVAVATDADVVADYGNSGFFFNIGGQGIQDGPTVNNGNAFNGFIDEVALYDKALSPSDVERHYDARDALSAINAVVKTGGGTLTLAGANTYDGGTTASSGILMVSGSTATGTVAVREAVLMGTGTIGGGVAVQTRGETNPGASVGTLSVTGGLTYSNFSSVFHAELDSAASYDQLSVGGDITLSNATLNLIKAPGYTPTPTDVLVLAMGSSVSGTFNGIPQGQRISAQGAEFVVSYLGNAITLNATGGFLTYAGPDTIVRPAGVGVSVPASQLLANDQVGDGVGPLMITSVLASSIENGTVSFDGTTVTFTPAPGYEGADSFTYTVTDGTDAVLGLVSVITGEPPAGEAATAILGGTQQLPNGDYRIAFRGTPGASYDIEWTQDLTEQPISWQVLGSVVAAPDGSILLDHAAPAGTVNYYRATLR